MKLKEQKVDPVLMFKVSRAVSLIIFAGIGYWFGYREGNDTIATGALVLAVLDYALIGTLIKNAENQQKDNTDK